MSYTTGTTHYNLPQTVGSDKRDWTDTNEAFSDVDAALWEAHQGATQAALDIASINSEIQTITGKQADDEADIATLSGKVSTLETTVGNHTTEIGDVRRDLQDNIESLREDTATSTHAYEIGDYFYYNDVLFKATAQIAIGATIVPNTNCTGVTVMNELKNGGGVDASEVTYGSSNVAAALDDKIDTFAGSVTDASSNTYTAVTADGIAYDATNNQLLLKVDGADTVIPFSRGTNYAHRLLLNCVSSNSTNTAYTTALDLVNGTYIGSTDTQAMTGVVADFISAISASATTGISVTVKTGMKVTGFKSDSVLTTGTLIDEVTAAATTYTTAGTGRSSIIIIIEY